jgi:hypothetical protein
MQQPISTVDIANVDPKSKNEKTNVGAIVPEQ